MRTNRTPFRVAALAAVVLLAAAPLTGSQQVAAQAPPGGDGGGTTFTLSSETRSITFTISGASVRQVPGAPEGNYEGSVTGDKVTLSGSAKYSLGDGYATNLSMSVALSAAGGGSEGARWPGPGEDSLVYGPIDWSESFSLDVPVTKGVTRSVSFSVEVRNCNDWGVCGVAGGRGTLTGWTPLCAEAEQFFLDQAAKFDKQGARVGYDQMSTEIQAALEKWKADHPGATLSMSPGGDAIAAGMWLFSDGGVDLSRWISSFSLSPDPGTKEGEKSLIDITVAQGKGELFDGTFTPPAGSESALAQSIALTSAKENRQLGFGDVYRLALEQTGGDTMLAAMLAHNTLRSLARVGTVGITGIVPDPGFFTKYLTSLRDGDNSGAWYHTFGTMYFQLEVAQGTSVGSKVYSTLGVAGAGLLYIPSWMFSNASEYFGWEKPFRFQQMLEAIINGSLPTTDTGWSGFANAAEQAYREIFGGRDPDPEKFCFNVWGTRLGELVHDVLFPTKPFQIFDSTKTNPYSNIAGDTISLDPLTEVSPYDLMQPLLRLGGTGSPVDVLLEANGVQLFLDQEAGVMAATGNFPYPVWPYVTDEDTYGLWWVVPPGQPDPTITYTAVDDGELHQFAINPNAGAIEVWTVEVDEGDTLAWAPADMTANPEEIVSAGAMTADGGELVGANKIDVEFSEDGHVLVSGGGRNVGLIALGGGLLLAAAVVVLLIWRRRPPTSAAGALPPRLA